MRPVRTKTTHAVLGAPHAWDEASHGVCEGLPVAVGDGVTFSYWNPNLMERMAIVFGGRVRLGIFSQSHPPVSLDTLT